MSVGGRAFHNGVLLKDQKNSVKAYYNQKENIQIEKKNEIKFLNNSFFKKISKIPLLRGILMFLRLIIGVFIESNKLILAIIALSMFNFKLVVNNNIIITSNMIWMVIVLIALIFNFSKMIETLKYHGAEHKIVNAFNDGFQKPINKYSRLANRCGTNLVVFFFLTNIVLSLVFNYFGFATDTTIFFIVQFLITYELFNKPPRLLLKLAMQVQRLTTREPGEKHLLAAREALFALKIKNYKPEK